MHVLRTCYALTMQYACAVHVLCVCSCADHAICTCSARAMHLQCNVHALCTCHACAPARTMRYARAPHVLCTYNAICTRYAHVMHVILHVPCNVHVLRTCYALTMQYSSMHALCTCYACAPAHTMRYARAPHVICTYNAICMRYARPMYMLLHVPCDMHVLRTCYALTMQYARAIHVLCTCRACASAVTMRFARAPSRAVTSRRSPRSASRSSCARLRTCATGGVRRCRW